nr:shootin-1-like [Pelodiscus sinensis]|eukprot:XP_025042352.1 shootin-1-like [Pelodiscus sinensis]
MHEALLQERDEAKEKLSEFEQASQKLLAELSALEAEYEIEKSCRKQAEVYAAQVNRENKKLKRISVALMPMLNQMPEDMLSLACEVDSPSDPSRDPAHPYVQQIHGEWGVATPGACSGCARLWQSGDWPHLAGFVLLHVISTALW